MPIPMTISGWTVAEDHLIVGDEFCGAKTATAGPSTAYHKGKLCHLNAPWLRLPAKLLASYFNVEGGCSVAYAKSY